VSSQSLEGGNQQLVIQDKQNESPITDVPGEVSLANIPLTVALFFDVGPDYPNIYSASTTILEGRLMKRPPKKRGTIPRSGLGRGGGLKRVAPPISHCRARPVCEISVSFMWSSSASTYA
jgi:hypothetical protein